MANSGKIFVAMCILFINELLSEPVFIYKRLNKHKSVEIE